jgi:Na+:H+ antiporter, NhaA family
MTHESPPLEPSRLAPLLHPISAFFAAESAGGILLIISAVAALVWANSPWASSYHDFWHLEIALDAGGFQFSTSLEHIVNDGLMVVFFLLVGLEIKRELLLGELASFRKASLPVAAAIGGMVVPALLYLLVDFHGNGAAGWGIPTATDIAFVAGILTLVGRSLPPSLKVFVLAVAIVDDLGAVLVIAIFYTSHVSVMAITFAALFFAALMLLNVLRVHHTLPYIVLGVGLWAATLCSGIHATIAGILLALAIPATRQIEEAPYVDYMRKRLERFAREAEAVPTKITENQSRALKSMEIASQAVQTPLARVEHALLKPVNFVIVPLFALANGGVNVRSAGAAAFTNLVTWGVLLGLLIGKPLGIMLASWIATKSKIASLPEGANWHQIAGVSVLCGIGFTMSLFIANLAFVGAEELLSDAKIGILAASLICGIVGALMIASAKPRNQR